jgi:hypothetical protein
MKMTPRERILAVYRGEQPDVVPCMLDLSHWFYHRHGRPWDLSVSYVEPERDLIAYHQEQGVGFYLPNLASLYDAVYPDNVRVTTEKRNTETSPEIIWRMQTPSGVIERVRVWQEQTYSWAISRWGFEDEVGQRVFQEAMSHRRYVPHWDRFRQGDERVGDCGIVYVPFGYSAIGYLLNQWMGIEATVFATVDFPEALREAVEAVNRNLLSLVDLICASPAQVVLMGDNLSSDVQPASFFNRWTRAYCRQAVPCRLDFGIDFRRCILVELLPKKRILLKIWSLVLPNNRESDELHFFLHFCDDSLKLPVNRIKMWERSLLWHSVARLG